MNNDIDIVSFSPALHLQRRQWVLDALRNERVTEIVDIGCEEGRLLANLCQPRKCLPPPNPEVLKSININKNTKPTSSILNPTDHEIRLKRIDGLDISRTALDVAIKATSIDSLKTNAKREKTTSVRWEPLELTIWNGGLESFNSAFVNVECIVATEVIEHLPEAVVADFAPMILGAYHPRLLLVTTPSYTFNARFSPPGVKNSSGFPDPTKRTDRVFRHHDHQFEWTIEEFHEWCKGAAKKWGYDVKMDTVGRADGKDKWNRDKEVRGASHVALFRRLDDDETLVTMREENSKSVRERSQTKHEKVQVRQYEADDCAGKRQPADEIAMAIVEKFEKWEMIEMRLEDIWMMEDIGRMCGGWMEVLIDAIKNCKKFKISRKGEYLSVQLVGSGNKMLLKPSRYPTTPMTDDMLQRARKMYCLLLSGAALT